MTDKFVLSAGQAHELEIAFRRNGWTAADVHYLCKGGVLTQVRTQLFGTSSSEAIEKYGHLMVQEVFTHQLCCEEFGYSKHMLSRIHSTCNGDAGKEPYAWETLAKLARHSESQMLRVPNLGRKGISLIRLVLSHYGLELDMEAARIYCKEKLGLKQT